MLPPIKGFIESTLIDWEGRLAAEVFLPGCNFRCSYCHAAHLIEPGDRLESIPMDVILQSLQGGKNWIDGVVISGGEPTLHKGLRELVQVFRNDGLEVKLDTNGSRPGALEALLEDGLIDYVAMDVKAPLDHRYAEVVGAPVEVDDIRASIEMLIAGDIGYEFRTTVCPAVLSPDAVVEAAQGVRGASQYFLQSFRPVNCLDPSLHSVKPYTGDEMRDMAARCAKYVQRCMVRGDAASEIVQNGQTSGIETVGS